MATNLSEKLQDALDKVRAKGRLTEKDIDMAMGDIRMALLEADVNFKVVKSFVARTRTRCLSSDILDSLTPGQNVIKVVLDELTDLLGSTDSKMELPDTTPNVIMLVGLQGSGKTTAAAKLAYLLKQQGHMPLLAACDVYRPAAADQLETLGGEIGVSVFRGDGSNPVKIATDAITEAKATMRDIVIVDTAGRLHVDEEMMTEAVNIKNATNPAQVLMVVDAMTGQDATNVVSAFAERVDFDGVIMSKMDGDARGGAALSVREITGKPIKFISEGEKPNSLTEFHPDRMAKRILGMGDMLSLIEQAQAAAEEEIEQAEAERMARADLTLDDFIMVNKQIHKMGGISKLLSALPGGDKAISTGQADLDFFDKAQVIVSSMTKEERKKPAVINGSRRARIAKGAGVEVSDVNHLIAKFNEMRKTLKKVMNVPGGGGHKSSNKRRPTKQSKGSRKARRRAEKRSMRGMGGIAGLGNMASNLGDLVDEMGGVGGVNSGTGADKSLTPDDIKKLQNMFGK